MVGMQTELILDFDVATILLVHWVYLFTPKFLPFNYFAVTNTTKVYQSFLYQRHYQQKCQAGKDISFKYLKCISEIALHFYQKVIATPKSRLHKQQKNYTRNKSKYFSVTQPPIRNLSLGALLCNLSGRCNAILKHWRVGKMLEYCSYNLDILLCTVIQFMQFASRKHAFNAPSDRRLTFDDDVRHR